MNDTGISQQFDKMPVEEISLVFLTFKKPNILRNQLIVIEMSWVLMSVEFEFAILNLPHVWRFFSIALMMHSDFIFVNIYVQGDNFKIVI